MKGIQFYTTEGTLTAALPLTTEVKKYEVSPKTYACAVRVLLQNWRQGTVGCKSRGEVAFSGKKPWKQKGTGRARAGMISSPVWRKGGVSFGPQPRVRTLKMPRAQLVLVLNNIFHSFYTAGKIACLDFNTSDKKALTKRAFETLRSIDLNNKKIILFLSSNDEANFAAFRNIPNVRVLNFDQPNAYDLSSAQAWVFLKKDIDLFNSMVAAWN